MENAIHEYGLIGIIIWIFIKDIVPLLITSTNKAVQIILPARAKQKHAELQHAYEVEEKKLDLQERQVVAWEQITKSQVLTEERLRQLTDQMTMISAALVQANSALALILDRMDRRREAFPHPPENKNAAP